MFDLLSVYKVVKYDDKLIAKLEKNMRVKYIYWLSIFLIVIDNNLNF